MSPQTTEPKPSEKNSAQALNDKYTPKSTAPASHITTSSATTRTKDILSILGTGLPILGAVGTVFCWTAANFYVGDVEVQTSRPYDTITVKVFDNKGSEATFHTPKFQLMPGNYHLVINADNLGTQHADTNVAFHAKTKVQVELPSDLDRKEAQEEPKAKSKHFWQFWKKD